MTTVDDLTHNENFEKLKSTHQYHPGKDLKDLTDTLNSFPFLIVEDAHMYNEVTYEDLEARDRLAKKEDPELYKDLPSFPEDFFVTIDNSMTFFTNGYIYFVIKKDQQGYAFKEKLDHLITENSTCFTLPRKVWMQDYDFDDNYAFVIEFWDNSIKPVYPSSAEGTYHDPDESNLFYKKGVEKVKIQERLFFERLRKITKQYIK